MSFKDTKGQDKTIATLQDYLKHGHLASSYLFVGPGGIGKKMVAKTLAKTLNCQRQSLDSCDECPSCLKIEKNQHPDVFIIDAATPLRFDSPDSGNSHAVRIGHIRQLQQDISLRPYEARYKVFIIDDAHNLTAEASNALLKILEEPPPQSVIILLSAKPNLLFKTIISRCQVLKFYPLTRFTLEELLKKDYSLHSHLAHFLAYFCDGRLGEVLKLKDTDILNEKNKVIDAFVISRNFRPDNFLGQKRDDLRRYLNILAAWFRDIYLIKTGTAHAELINCDRKGDLLKFMPHFSFLDLDEIFQAISGFALRLEENINIKLLLANLRMEVWKG